MRKDACDPDLSADQLCRGEEAGLLRVVHVLQQLPSASLKNRTLLAELVRAVGLSNTGSFGGSRFYGSEQRYVLGPEDPSSRVRYGVCQLPEQLADALATLASLDKRIHTFAEVGTAGGVTAILIVLVLRRVAREISLFKSLSVDILDQRSCCAKRLQLDLGHGYYDSSALPRTKRGAAVDMQHPHPAISSLGLATRVDLCFIDGDHRLAGVLSDYEQWRGACNYLLFHDVFDGFQSETVVRFWRALVQAHNDTLVWEFTQQVPGLGKTHRTRDDVGRLGLGLIRRPRGGFRSITLH